MTHLEISASPSDLTARAADLFIISAQAAIQDRGRFSVALSGGSTPLPVYQRLASTKPADQLDWSRIDFYWGDERTVPPDDPQSNFGHARQLLLEPRGVPAGNIHRIEGERPPQEAAKAYQELLRSSFQEDPPDLDLILLGMGGDGHTASLFPGTGIVTAPPSETGLAAAVYVPKLETWRISLTPRVIEAAQQIVFLVSGTEKANTLAQVLEGPFQPELYPSQLFREKALWLVDEEAASQLQQTA